MKAKFSGAGIKGFFLEHGEKVVVGVSVLCLLLFVYKAIGRPTLDPTKSNDRLDKQAANAEQHINRLPYAVASVPKFVVPPVAPPAALTDIDPIKPLVWPPKPKRSDPSLFVVEDLRGVGGVGAFAMAGSVPAEAAPAPAPPGPGKRPVRGGGGLLGGGAAAAAAAAPRPGGENAGIPQGRYYVVVTGAVPYLKQLDEYNRRLLVPAVGDKNSGKDQPNYLLASVERAEITDPNTPEAGLKYVLINNGRTATEERARWASEAPEVAAAESINPVLAWPLPPLMLRQWSFDEVAHPQVAPATTEAEAAAGVVPAQGAPNAVVPPDEVFDPNGNTKTVKPKVEEAKVEPADKRGPENLLFRFVDFNVAPGKYYRYRVRLYLKNPNYGEPPMNLEKPNPAALNYVATDWSKPSPAIGIAPITRLLAVAVKPATTFLKDTTAKIGISTFDMTRGVEAVQTFDNLSLGSIANFTSKVDVISPTTGTPITLEDFVFTTNSQLIDLRGGDPIVPKDKLTEPAELLFSDDRGNISVHTESDDRGYLEAKLEEVKVAEAPAPAAGGALDAALGGLPAAAPGVRRPAAKRGGLLPPPTGPRRR